MPTMYQLIKHNSFIIEEKAVDLLDLVGPGMTYGEIRALLQNNQDRYIRCAYSNTYIDKQVFEPILMEHIKDPVAHPFPVCDTWIETSWLNDVVKHITNNKYHLVRGKVVERPPYAPNFSKQVPTFLLTLTKVMASFAARPLNYPTFRITHHTRDTWAATFKWWGVDINSPRWANSPEKESMVDSVIDSHIKRLKETKRIDKKLEDKIRKKLKIEVNKWWKSLKVTKGAELLKTLQKT